MYLFSRQERIFQYILANLNDHGFPFEMACTKNVQEGVMKQAENIASEEFTVEESLNSVYKIGNTVFSSRKSRFHILVFCLFAKFLKNILARKTGINYSDRIARSLTKVILDNGLGDTMLNYIESFKLYDILSAFLFMF